MEKMPTLPKRPTETNPAEKSPTEKEEPAERTPALTVPALKYARLPIPLAARFAPVPAAQQSLKVIIMHV